MIVLMPTEEIDDPTPGSIVVTADCGHECWLAPSTVDIQKAHPGMPTYCTHCSENELGRATVEVHIKPGQLLEVAVAMECSEEKALETIKQGLDRQYHGQYVLVQDTE